MENFVNTVAKYKRELIIEQEPAVTPEAQPVEGDPAAAAAPVAPPPAPPKPLTTEGKRFMVELALKALAYNPDHIADPEKDIFTNEVTPENAEEMLEKIQRITGDAIERADTPEAV